MTRSRPRWPIVAAVCAVVLGVFLWPRPERDAQLIPRSDVPREVPEHVIILDEADGEFLMYVSVEVHEGDRLLTPDNRIFEVVRVDGSRAYAHFVGMRNIGTR